MNPRIYSVLCIIALLLYPCIFVQEAFAASKSSDIKALEKEIKLGKSVAEDIEKQWPRVLEPSKTARAEMILQRLRPYMERSLDYEVRVVEQKMVNAFSLPGGITYVTTGMLDFIKTDTELAAVIAHELVHGDREEDEDITKSFIDSKSKSKIELFIHERILPNGGEEQE